MSRKCGQMWQANLHTTARPMRPVPDTKKRFSATPVAAPSYGFQAFGRAPLLQHSTTPGRFIASGHAHLRPSSPSWLRYAGAAKSGMFQIRKTAIAATSYGF